MAELVGQYQQTSFSLPSDGVTAFAGDVKTNDNALRAKTNSHDADAGIHFQSGVEAARPAFGTVGTKWYSTDTKKLWYDTGSAWSEITPTPGTHTHSIYAPTVHTHVKADITDLGTLLTYALTSGKTVRATAASTLAAGSISDDGTVVGCATQPRFASAISSVAPAAGATSYLTLLTPSLNVGPLWATGNQTRMTVPAGAAGDYLCAYTGGSSNVNVGLCTMWLEKNRNGTVIPGTQITIYGTGTGLVVLQSCSAIIPLVATDYLELAIQNNDAVGRTYQAVAFMSKMV